MATLNIGGQRVTVDDAFLSMTPEQQNQAVEEIAQSLPQQSVGDQFGSVASSATQQLSGNAREIAADDQGEATGTILDPINQGLTFGFGDEIKGAWDGAGRALQGGNFAEGYSDSVDRSRGDLEAFRERHPIVSTAAEVAGAIPTALAGGGAAATKGASLLSRAGASALTGASQGAVYGAGTGQDSLVDRATNSAVGAGTGLLAGFAAPFAGSLAGRVAQKVTGRAPSKAATALNRAILDDEIPIDHISKKISDLGEGATVADLGPNLQRQAGALASQPGNAQKIVRDAIVERAKSQSGRILNDVQSTLGSTKPAFAVADDITRAQQQAAAPLYDAVRDMPVNPKSSMTIVMNTPMGRAAFKKAVNMAANEGAPQSDKLTIGTIDYAKRALDDMASSAARAGRNNEARQARQLARLLLADADEAVPGYAQARQAFAGPAAVKDALELGQSAFSNKMHPGQLKQQMDRMTASEKEALLKGAQAAIQDLMGGANNDARAVRRAFEKSFNVQKLEMLIGKEEATKLMRALDREIVFGQTANAVTGNSETAARLAAQGEVSVKGTPGFVRELANMNFGNAFHHAFDASLGKIGAARQKATNEALAKVLSSGKVPPEMLGQLRAIQAGSSVRNAGEKALVPLAVPVAGQIAN